VTTPEIDVLPKPDATATVAATPVHGRTRSENCARMKELGFTVSRHIKMYGRSFEIVSEPFSEGDCVAVRATSGNDPEICTLRLPTAILVGAEDRFLKTPDSTAQSNPIV
jgi:hypothetical protein